VRPRTLEDVRALFRLSHERQVPLTFRAAGTSLSGQAVTDGILADVSRHWRAVAVEDKGRKVRVQPGVVGARVNALLRPHGRKIGPDPASLGACMMGGILSNNASGMCCGTAQNSYRTLASMKVILADGAVLDVTQEPNRGLLLYPVEGSLRVVRDGRDDVVLNAGGSIQPEGPANLAVAWSGDRGRATRLRAEDGPARVLRIEFDRSSDDLVLGEQYQA